MSVITKEELQEIEDALNGKTMLDDEELLYWLKKDMRKLLAAYTAAMHDVTIRDGQEPEGAVAALVEAMQKYIAWESFEYRPGTGSQVGRKLWADVKAALARLEVDDTEPAD